VFVISPCCLLFNTAARHRLDTFIVWQKGHQARGKTCFLSQKHCLPEQVVKKTEEGISWPVFSCSTATLVAAARIKCTMYSSPLFYVTSVF